MHLDDLALELVDSLARIGARRREDVLLDLLDVVLYPRDHRRVLVDHAVDDRVQGGAGAASKKVGLRLDPLASIAELGSLPVAHRDDEFRTQEERNLAEL